MFHAKNSYMREEDNLMWDYSLKMQITLDSWQIFSTFFSARKESCYSTVDQNLNITQTEMFITKLSEDTKKA